MKVSVVERQVWKRCRRQWWLTAESQQSLQPKGLVPALKLGDMVQKTLSYWQEHVDEDPLISFKRLSTDALDNYKLQYEGMVGAEPDESELDKLYDVIELGLGMITNYRDYYKTPLPKGYRMLQTEQRALIDIPGTEHWECEFGHMWDGISNYFDDRFPCRATVSGGALCEGVVSRQCHQLRGTFDSLVQHEQSGKIFVLERKTYGNRPSPEKLLHDDQMLAYDWCIHQLFGAQAVGGTLYDGLWKRAKVPNSKTKGRPTTMDDMFYRDIFVRPPHEREEFEHFLKLEVEDMVEAVQHNRLFINRPWMGCEMDCGMIRLCNAISRGEDVDYVRNTFYKPREFGNILDEVRED